MNEGDSGGRGSALADAVRAWGARLSACHADGGLPSGHDREADRAREELLAALEMLKNAACAVQATLAVQLEGSVRAQDAAAGKPAAVWARDVASRVALARGESPHRGSVLLGLARDLHTDLPCALSAMRMGLLSEFRAAVVDRETGCLSREDRMAADAELFAPGPDGAPAEALFVGTRNVAARAQRIACRLDAAAMARRRARAQHERCVTLRPAPEGMAYLTALLPMAQGIAAHVALSRRAQCARAGGDTRGKGQLMADLLITDLLGSLDESQSEPQAGAGPARTRPAVGVMVDLVISDRTLFAGGNEPAFLLGNGSSATPIDAPSARLLLADALAAHPETQAWVRRLYSDPHGRLVALSSAQRFAGGALAEFLRIRDQGSCRTPWCDAPIAEIDHVVPDAHGGPTDEPNLQGLCVACNRVKQAGGWDQRHSDAHAIGRHTVTTLTPTGRTFTTTAPAPPPPIRAHAPPAA